jgi:hypothetical protein
MDIDGVAYPIPSVARALAERHAFPGEGERVAAHLIGFDAFPSGTDTDALRADLCPAVALAIAATEAAVHRLDPETRGSTFEDLYRNGYFAMFDNLDVEDSYGSPLGSVRPVIAEITAARRMLSSRVYAMTGQMIEERLPSVESMLASSSGPGRGAHSVERRQTRAVEGPKRHTGRRAEPLTDMQDPFSPLRKPTRPMKGPGKRPSTLDGPGGR